MKLYKIRFKTSVGNEHDSRACFFADAQACLAYWLDLCPSTMRGATVNDVRECTAFERAEHLVAQLNEQHISATYGQSALHAIAGCFGGESAEYTAYLDFLNHQDEQERNRRFAHSSMAQELNWCPPEGV